MADYNQQLYEYLYDKYRYSSSDYQATSEAIRAYYEREARQSHEREEKIERYTPVWR